LAVNVGATATPLPSAPTVTMFDPLEAKIPLAPEDGAVNSTAVPARSPVTGQPLLLASSTCRFV
jgi:hypothetical protein